MFKRISHIAMKVTNLDKSLEFYVGKLGLSEKFRLLDKTGKPWLVYIQIAEGQFIELFPNASDSFQRSTNAGYVHVSLEVDDIDDVFEKLSAKGVTISKPLIMAVDRARQFWIEDPDGNPIEIQQFTEDSMEVKGY